MGFLTGSAAASATQDASAWPPLLTIARAVAYSGCSKSTINRAIASGELPLHGRVGKHGRLRVIRRDEIDRWLAGDVGADDTAPTERRTTPKRTPDTSAALDRIKRAAGRAK